MGSEMCIRDRTFSGPLNIFIAICRRIPILSNMVIKRGLFKDKFFSLIKLNLKNDNIKIDEFISNLRCYINPSPFKSALDRPETNGKFINNLRYMRKVILFSF